MRVSVVQQIGNERAGEGVRFSTTLLMNKRSYIINNFNRAGNIEIAKAVGIKPSSVCQFLWRNGLKRTDLHKKQLRIKAAKTGYAISLAKLDQTGSNNGNWKNGISKNGYHYKKIQKLRYPERIKARDTVGRALRSGILTKQSCEKCGNKKSFAHHPDYKQPLKIVWLCRKHHREVHNNKH